MEKSEKILCFIDSFNSGGAQKQLVMLANGLCNKGKIIETLQYHDINFFSNTLEKNIKQNKVLNKGGFSKLFNILKFLYLKNPSVIISFLHGPNNYAALYKMIFFWREVNLIVGERNLNLGKFKVYDFLIRFSHLFANTIVCNSNAQKKKLSKLFNKKIHFIPNGTSIKNISEKNNFNKETTTRFIVPARFILQKNPLNTLKALNEIENIEIHWYGEVFKQFDIYKECIEFINENKLNNKFFFREVVKDIYSELIKYDALLLPSFYEGCPNAIIDAMFCKLPVIASNVSDNSMYLEHQSSLLFDPNDYNDIVSKIEWFLNLSSKERKEFGEKNREKAFAFFDEEKMINNYIELF